MAKAAAPRVGPEQNMVAIVGMAIALKGDPNFACQRGTVVRPDHPAVKAAPLYFMPADSTTEEFEAALLRIAPPPPNNDR